MFFNHVNGKCQVIGVLVVFFLLLLILVITCNNRKVYSTKDGEMLTQEQILKIANKKAKRFEILPDENEVLYGVEKAKWQENLKFMEKISPGWSKEFEILNGRNYVIVLYRPKDPGVMGGVLWLFIDRKTGEIIAYLPEM